MTRPPPAAALVVVRLAAALIPDAGRRARYREQWRADVYGAAELGLSPLRVALGAGAAALQMPKGPHAMLPIGPLALALKLAGTSRRHAAILAAVSALALLGGVLMLVSG